MPRTIKGLIFDFDGLILDTETPTYLAWQKTFETYGVDLPITVWGECIGGASDSFDAIAYLQDHLTKNLDREATYHQYEAYLEELMDNEKARPGVNIILKQARDLGVKVSIASSSPKSWVEGHLKKMDLFSEFPIIITSDDSPRVKPEPDLFLMAAERLEIELHEGIVFEDSPNGILAANRAGILCVAVPNSITALLDLSAADLILPRLDSYGLTELFNKLNGHQ
jgi:HAD superfamily hydrolase (TIGR01509 family)